MSNALALATVTQALALLIEHNLHPEIDLAVSVETRKPPTDPPTDPTITVFLYQVTHNPSMRNNDLVTRASDGTLLKRPAAAIDLHFLISAYGEEQELVGQRLIGSVVRTLHEIPVLPKELIEEAADRPYLAGSDLAESPQKVRFTPTQMDVDETSKLWGMLNNTPYALSVAYQASLVLLDGHQKPAPARPVKRPEVTVVPEVPPEVPLGTLTGGAADPARTAGASGVGAAGSTEPPGSAEPAGTGESAGATAGAMAKAAEDATATAKDAATNAARKPAKRTGGGKPQPTKTATTHGSSDAGRPGPRTRTRTRKTADGGPQDTERPRRTGRAGHTDDTGGTDDGGES
ncbi:DUF4255 domain-containing protein [Streptomyces noursei]|uniref:DUF4255 domain-containing protein n=1 Tax=Streptomyces noursei TaxID=1971 RepID=UPI00081D0023|nr:hypothetical protein SNOUR_17215 [Streptomyces noursei ATCC 11455]MCZ0993762.1 DUF4255 domain-containing protein [Streptomyces noursei]